MFLPLVLHYCLIPLHLPLKSESGKYADHVKNNLPTLHCTKSNFKDTMDIICLVIKCHCTWKLNSQGLAKSIMKVTAASNYLIVRYDIQFLIVVIGQSGVQFGL